MESRKAAEKAFGAQTEELSSAIPTKHVLKDLLFRKLRVVTL